MPIGQVEPRPRLSPFYCRAQAKLAIRIAPDNVDGSVDGEGDGVRVAQSHVEDILAAVNLDVVGDSAESAEGLLATMRSARGHPPGVYVAALCQCCESVSSSRNLLDWFPEAGKVGYDARLRGGSTLRAGQPDELLPWHPITRGEGGLSRVGGDLSSEAILETSIAKRRYGAIAVQNNESGVKRSNGLDRTFAAPGRLSVLGVQVTPGGVLGKDF